MTASNQISIPSLSFRNILIGLDFSPSSLLALPFAANIAAHYRSKLFISHISAGEEDQSHSLTSQAALEKLEAGAEAGLFDTLGALKEIPHEFLFNHGSICSTLIAVADECKVDLIVVGTHGWRGIKKFLKGCTAEEIAFLASSTGTDCRTEGRVSTRIQAHSFRDGCFTDFGTRTALCLLFCACLRSLPRSAARKYPRY